MDDMKIYPFTIKLTRWLAGGSWYKYGVMSPFGYECFWTRKKLKSNQLFALLKEEHYGS
jgi:hypothetical protein